MIHIVDYGMGNLRSVQKAFESLGCEAVISSDPSALASADRLVLPGVGAFGACATALRSNGLDQSILGHIHAGKPFLGICVGCQLLLEWGEELGVWPGLGVLKGTVRGFAQDDFRLKVPHIGWNSLEEVTGAMMSGIENGSYVYFVHSFFPTPSDASVIAATTEYGVRFVSAVEAANVWATQFHPEKSGAVGLSILRNFARA